MDSKMLEELIRKVVMEQMAGGAKGTNGVMSVKLPQIKLTEEDRFDVGDPNKKVYLRVITDVIQITEAPLIASGLIQYKEEVVAALRAGAAAISTTAPAVWEL